MAIGTGTAILLGSLGAGAAGVIGARKGAKAQEQASAAGIAEQRRQFDIIQGLTQPGREAGNEALNTLGSAFIPGFEGIAGFDAIDQGQLSEIFQNLPGTQFALDEVEKSVGNSFASRGGAFGGNAMRALGDRTANFASDRVFNNLLQIAGFGPGATNTAASSAQNTGNNISQLLTNAGNAQASGFQGQAGSINNAIQGGLSNFLLNRYLGQNAPGANNPGTINDPNTFRSGFFN